MKTNKLSIWLSSIAFVLALLATGFAYLRCTPMQADWMAILIGILAFITAVLLAVQFFNYAVFNKEIECKVQKVEAAIYQRNKEYMEGILNYSEGFMNILHKNSFQRGYGISYKMFVSALSCFCNYGKEANECLGKSLNGIEIMINDFEENWRALEHDHPNMKLLNNEIRANFEVLDLARENDFIKEKVNILSYKHDKHLEKHIEKFLEYEKRRQNIVDTYISAMNKA